MNLLFSEIETKEAKIVELENYIYYIAKPYYKEIDVLTSMIGISIKTAIAIISDIADIKRFNSSKKLSAYLRSAPGIDSSNNTVRNLKTSKFGRKLSITFISQALNHFRDNNSKLNKWYYSKIDNNHSKGKIRMALCRKVITEIYQMLKKMEYHYNYSVSNHSQKIKAYDKFLKNYTISEKYSNNFKISA